MNRARILQFLRQPELVCLAGVLLFGPLLALLTPPIQSPDEGAHLFRIWQISRGVWVAPNLGGEVPTSLIEFNGLNQPRWLDGRRTGVSPLLQNFHQKLNPQKTQWLFFASAALYSPLPYSAQTLGMLAGRAFDAPPVLLMYLGRLMNVLVYALLGWAVVRVTPLLKWTLCVLLLSPLPIFLAGTLSADPTTIGLGLLATAMLLRLILFPGPIGWAPWAAAAASLAGVALCKSVYVPVAALVLAVPAARWGSRPSRWIMPLMILIVTVAAAAQWSALANPLHARQRGGPPADQLHWIAHHPLGYAAVCARTLHRDGVPVLISTIGVLGWLDTLVGQRWVMLYFALMLWATLNDASAPATLGLRTRLIAAAAVLLSLAAIATSIYMLWEKPGEPYLDGIQGRYALPLALLVAMVFHRRGKNSIPPALMTALIFIGCAHTVWIVLRRYYVL